MAQLKQKFKSLQNLIQKQPDSQKATKSPELEVNVTSAELTAEAVVVKEKAPVYDPQVDQEILDSIEKDYFDSQQFDASLFELEKLPEVGESLELGQIDSDRQRLRGQLQAVSKKVSDLVLQNHSAFVDELHRVIDLQESLQTATVVCKNGRRQLSSAKERFTTASLGLLANYKKRQKLVGLLNSMSTIKTLQRTDIRLREMLEEEDYPGAIQLCLECQKAASTFRHYKCISELSSKLQDTLEMIEEQLDVALSKTCGNFDMKYYDKVQTAYRLLGKTQTAMDQLHMHFTSAVHNTAFTIVLGYVELTAATSGSNFQKRQYNDLCKNVTPETFTSCLIDLCKALWEVMKSYHQTMEWHEQKDKSLEESGSGSTNVDAHFTRRYVKQKLEHGLSRIWGDVQQKVKTYILSTDLSYFKFDEFIDVLDIINRLIMIGEEFCGSKSEGLQDSIRKQSVNYFRNYHRARMDELKMFLENEAWQLCPVKANFSIMQLQEFKFLRSHAQQQRNIIATPTQSPEHTVPTNRPNYGFFTKFDNSSPFDLPAQEDEDEEKEDVMATNGYMEDRQLSVDSESDEDIPEELKQDFVDEQTGELPVKRPTKLPKSHSGSLKRQTKLGPVLTNTTLNVIRLIGKYAQMMSVLKPIAFDVIICMSQIFDYYLYTIYSFFGIDLGDVNELSLSNKLRTTLKRIKDNLIYEEQQVTPTTPGVPTVPTAEEKKDKFGQPYLSGMVDLSVRESLYGLAARVVAAESLVFLAEQFEYLQPTLDNMIPQAKKAFLQQFYSQTVTTAVEIRKPVYRTVAAKSIDYENLFNLMATTVKWDIKDIMSQHSSYVDRLLQEFHAFNSRLQEVSRRVPIPKVVEHILWEYCIRLSNRTFVEGYASAKKCTNEGRALMQLDFQQFLMKLEKLTDLRPIPDREYVEAYIKAYYLPEAQLELWVKDHREYSVKQLVSIVNCVDHKNKKARQRLINSIEETWNRR
ncbi:unnamed protein product [Owenia fusiformis]|uniref:Uncharacterized protein n=1 Tax=Owenia fusiformis TaxID=6347 RepID=A0A8J1UHB3_OWEFU|nr:unnamed protein product [Owenia fusiformis]